MNDGSPSGAGDDAPAPFDRMEAIRAEYRHNVQVFLAFGVVGARWRAQQATAAILDASLMEVLDAIEGMPDEP